MYFISSVFSCLYHSERHPEMVELPQGEMEDTDQSKKGDEEEEEGGP